MQTDLDDIHKQLGSATEMLVEKYYEGSSELSEYLKASIYGIAMRLKNAAESRGLCRML